MLQELKRQLEKGDKGAFDTVRRKYLSQLHQYTGRNTILYATKWVSPTPDIPPEMISITDEDIQGLMEVFYGLSGSDLDLIIHSPGGSAEATESMVSYLRSKFTNIRVFVPQAAMSAATMLACAANKIVMGKHSSLGPIDPQMILNTPLGQKAIPAQAILDQFEEAKKECKDPQLLGAWAPILPQYGPALLTQCKEALELSKQLVSKWLSEYMFRDEGGSEKATKVADALADHKTYKTHGRHIDRAQALSLGLTIDALEADQKLQDLVLSVYHATMHTFNSTPAVKIIENHNGRAVAKTIQLLFAAPAPPGQQPAPPSQAQPTTPPASPST